MAAREEFRAEPKGWRPLQNPIPRFLSKIHILDSGCWQWTAAIYRNGYGVFQAGQGAPRYAHRWSYIFFVGKIPEGYVVDHLCRNPGCVNPVHLEAVSPQVNNLRSAGPELTRARYLSRTHCSRGHALVEENVYRDPKGRRICKICRREYDNAWKRAVRRGEPTKLRSISPAEDSRIVAEPKQKRWGDPKERFLSSIEITDSGCWNWTAGHFPNGYGKFRAGKTGTPYAHRCAYIFFVAPIPDGTVIDHLCRNPACVNPAHLEAVTPSENSRRGEVGKATGARNRAKTHCPSGHPYDGENTYWNRDGERSCRTCQRLRVRANYWRKKDTGDQQS